MRCQTPGELLLDARRRHGLTQRRLAIRAGTSQDAISRIERCVESPTLERLRHLLLAMGEDLELRAGRAGGFAEHDSEEIAAARALSPAERLRESASWNLVAMKLELAVAEARRAGHPATRRSMP